MKERSLQIIDLQVQIYYNYILGMIEDIKDQEEGLTQTISLSERQKTQVTVCNEREGVFRTNQSGYAYLHVESQKGLRAIKLRDLPFSRTILSFYAKTLRLLDQVNGSEWVVLPCYLNKQPEEGEKVVQISDCQLVVTGKIKTQLSETSEDATIREIKEEIGLDLSEEKIIGLGQDREITYVRDRYKRKVYPSIVRLEKILKKHVNFDHLQSDNHQNQEGPKESIQSWIIVRDTDFPYFFERKRDSKNSVGYIVALIQVKKLVAIITELRDSIMENVNRQLEINAQAQQIPPQEEHNSGEEQDQKQNAKIPEVQQSLKNYTGSVKWQRQVENMDQDDLDEFIQKIKKEVWILAKNKCGNHLVKKICYVGDYQHRQQILKIIAPDLGRIVQRFYGTRLLQDLILFIVSQEEQQLLQFLFNTVKTNNIFDKIAINQNGSHFLRTLIKYLPPSEIISIKHMYEPKNLDAFVELVCGKYSVFVMNCILVKLEFGCRQGVEGAQKRKKQFLDQLSNCFQKIIGSFAIFLIERAYMILDPRDLEKLTAKLMVTQEYIMFKGNKQYIKPIKKFCSLLIECHYRYWMHPFYEKYYDSIDSKLNAKQIKKIMGANFPNFLLRTLVNIKILSPMKIKIANVIFNMDVPHHIFQEAKIKKWHQRLNSALLQFEVNYHKTESGWVLRKDHKLEMDPKVLQQKHQQSRLQQLQKFTYTKEVNRIQEIVANEQQ